MDKTPDEIESSLEIPDAIVLPMLAVKEDQDAARGDWDSPRENRQPDPPWPPMESPILRYLLTTAQMSIDAGMEPRIAMLQLAATAWFEGGIEGYDRGQQDARRPRLV